MEWLALKRKPDVLFVCDDVDRGTKINGKIYSQFLDPMAFALEQKGYSIERITWPISKQRPNQQLFRYINVDCLISMPFDWIYVLFFRYLCSPSLIVAIGWNDRFFCAAKKIGIKTLEPIHSYGINRNDNYFGVKSKIRFTPDVYLTFDDQTAETLSENIYRNFLVFRCKHPYFERKLFVDQWVENNELISYLIDKKCVTKVILVTLQHGYEGTRDYFANIIANGVIHESLVESIRSNRQYFWIIKAHPVQLAREDWLYTQIILDSLFNKCSHVDARHYHYEDIMQLLTLVDLHITMSSSTITEAATFRCTSIGLCPTLKNGNLFEYSFQNARNEGLLVLCDLDSLQIDRAIVEILNLHKGVELPSKSDNSIDKIHPFASEVIQSFLCCKSI